MLAAVDHVRVISRDLDVLGKFVACFCKHRHGDVPRKPFSMNGLDLSPTRLGRRLVCASCRSLLAHAVSKRARCTLSPKPSCRHCQVHCYSPTYREKIRAVMKFSGRHLVLRGQVHLLLHFLSRPPRKLAADTCAGD